METERQRILNDVVDPWLKDIRDKRWDLNDDMVLRGISNGIFADISYEILVKSKLDEVKDDV